MHWIRVHPDNGDLAHIERMQYPSVKLFEWHWSDRDACANLLAVLPKNAYILARDHPLSEQEFWGDPVGIGKRHADEWMDKVRSGRYHLPIDRTFFLGRNEPDATNGDRTAIDRYTVAFLDQLRAHGLRGGAFNFATGHPRTIDGTPYTQPDYTVFEASHQAIVRGHHIAVAHIYGTAAVPCAPGHYDRLRACKWDNVPWVIGEFGIDEHVVGGGPHDGFHVPYAGRLEDYCAWLDTAILGIADPRIHSYQIFTYDYSKPWSTFDVSAIRDALERRPWEHGSTQGGNGGTVYIPVIQTPGNEGPTTPPTPLPTPPTPELPSGIVDPRVAAAVLAVESGGAAFSADGRLVIRFENHIFKGKLGDDALYAAHFSHDQDKPWMGHNWRPNAGGPWRPTHTGNQADEWAAYAFAKTLNAEAATQALGMGAAQIMGFNHARVGYPSAQAMLSAFGNEAAQIVAFLNYLLSDPALWAAVRAKDWRTIALLYNGSGQVDYYAGLLQQAYARLGGSDA